MSWRQMATDNYTASHLLFASGHWRSAVSRAYYAAYARATAGLTDDGVTVGSSGRGNPAHGALANLVLHNWTQQPLTRRSAVGAMLYELFGLRVMADYKPLYLVDEADARTAIGLMSRIFQMIGS